ncbi:unnamed protein product [Allacma fusca]|uniref:KIF-binding protein n=1 Tax=Allacma fusca TaxID=39272 RepID=A0A8J2PWV8_9HEXA|nr:unnamed protein product [Allacma fusca]
MAGVMITNMECFEAARNVLLAATAVLNKCTEEEKSSDQFKQNYAELGRSWAKLGNELLEASADRLKDLEEQTRKPPKFQSKLVLTSSEIQSLGIDYVQEEYDTILLIQSLHFPSVDFTEVLEKEMRGKYVRDFDEARNVFLPLQRWINVSKAYYKIDEFASDYIDIVTDYSNAFKYLAFFEPSLERQIKMHKRRVLILEELLANLNAKVYEDVFHFCLRDLAEINETIYKLKVAEIKERGESLRPKDKKLVKWLTDSINAHKRNLTNFKFDVDDPKKDFDPEYEKALLGSVLSIGRILGSISHDHPLHSEALEFAVEGKKFYQYFLSYLDYHEQLKHKDFKVLYEGTQDMPDLMDKQIRKITDYASRRHN